VATGPHVLLLSLPGDADGEHTALVEAIRERLPNLGWNASWRVYGGSWDLIDAIDFQPGEEPEVVAELLRERGVRFELLRAEPSEWLRAPGPGLPEDPLPDAW
jgi:hypothetical protein